VLEQRPWRAAAIVLDHGGERTIRAELSSTYGRIVDALIDQVRDSLYYG
jgi:hypothetical protein